MSPTLHPYNLFRRSGEGTFYCAVPEDRVVPAFLSGSSWKFARKLESAAALPFGFNRRAAQVGVRFNGFYLYQTPPQ